MAAKNVDCPDDDQRRDADMLLSLTRSPASGREAANDTTKPVAKPRSIRTATRKYPVDLHVAYKLSGTAAIFHGKVVASPGKYPAQVESHCNKTGIISVLTKDLIFPVYKVGDKVQVMDKHSTACETHGKKVTYWYEVNVLQVIANDQGLPDYIIDPVRTSQ